MILPLCSDSQMNKCPLPISGAKFQPAKPPHLTSTTEQILSALLGQLICLFCLKRPSKKLQLIKISQYCGGSIDPF